MFRPIFVAIFREELSEGYITNTSKQMYKY